MQYTSIKFLLASILLFSISCSTQKIQPGVAGNQTIRVMTYNVHHCNPPGKENMVDIDAIAAVIKEQDAAIVAVQEVDVNTRRSGKINQAEQLATKAGYPSFYFAKAMDFDSGQYGILILSKYPLQDTRNYPLPMAESSGDEPRVVASATVKFPNGKSIRFGCTHLEAYNKQSRLLQAKEINRIAAETPLPFIIAGDFNANEGSEVINMLDEHFTRTCNNCPPTFVEATESGAIDFIAVKPKEMFIVVSHTVVPDKEASDHMPVIAVLQLK